jgi:hypothetical protein
MWYNKYMETGKKHGSPSTYNNLDCRCEACKGAWAAYHRQYSLAYRERNLELERKRRREYWYRKLALDPEGTRERQRIAKAKYAAKKKAQPVK